MGKGSPNNRSVFDFKPGTLQVDRPNDGVLGQPLSPAPANVSPFVSVGAAPVQTLQSPFERVLQDQRESYGGFTAAEVRQNKNREALSQAPEPAQTNITVNTPMPTAPATLDFSDDGGIDIEPATPFVPRPEPDPRSFVGQPAAPSPTPFLQEIGAATPDAPEQGMGGFSSLVRGVAESDAPAESSGFGKGGTRGGSSFGRFGSRGFSKGARGYSQGGSLARSLISLIGRQPEFQAQLANSSMPNAQRAFNTMFAVPMQEGGALDQAFTQGFKSGVLEPIIATPIPNNADPYGSAAGLTSLMRPPVYQGVNAYNRGIPVGQPTTPTAIQMAQGFANPSVFSYNNPNPQGGGTMPSGLAGVAQAQQQPGQMPMAGQAPNQIQPYTMGT